MKNNNKNNSENEELERDLEGAPKMATNEEEVKKETSQDEAPNTEETIEAEAGEENLATKLDQIEAEVEEWKQSYLRKQAEFQNFTKRKENELQELRKYAAEKVIVKVLEAVDNLERGMGAAKDSNDFEALTKGVEMTLGQMQGILKEEGVEAIDSAPGTDFDPYVHQGVMTENNPEFDDNQITMELQKGYRLNERVIRPAMVKVNKK